MNFLTKSLVSSLLFALTIGNTYAQKKYLKRNNRALTVVYGDSSIYSRGLYSEGYNLFLGNSDGSIYKVDLRSNHSEIIFKKEGLREIRDIESNGEFLYGMHSGTNGKLIKIAKDNSIEIINPLKWTGIFLDGMDIEKQRGFLMGDPIRGKFSLFHSNDGGANWSRCEGEVSALKEEAGFAASGSNVQVINDSTYVFVTGGEISHFFKSTDNGKSWKTVVLPYFPGKSNGAYSVHFSDDKTGVIVGGDYQDPTIRLNTCFYTFDGGESWFNSLNPVRGYRSCVYHVNGVFYACGRNGIDYSTNGGADWLPFADGAYFSMIYANGKLVATTKHGAFRLFDLILPKK